MPPRYEREAAGSALRRLREGDFAAAAVAAAALWARAPKDIEAITTLGLVWAALDDHALARTAFERALSIRPDDPELLFNLATSLRNFGELQRAEFLYDEVIRRRPDDWEAFKNRSELRRQTPRANHLRELQAALTRTGSNWRGQVMLLYALGKEREDLGDYDAAFQAFGDGARLRRRHMTYNAAEELARVESIRMTFDTNWLARLATGHSSPEPIFIFGLPRSGSTLLERMLSAHSAITAAGELQNFGLAVMRLAAEIDAGAGDLIGRSARLDLRRLGEVYLASTRPRTGQTARFIDKLPGNFLYAGLIAAALPNATLIHIHRDPRDAGVAMYKTLFKQAYPFSYDLHELSRYIVAYRALMAHWRVVLPGRIVDVSYEQLVDEPEAVVGDILNRCGLPFEPDCLQFYESTEAASTASAVQIRRPIYRTSVAAWRRYEHHLSALIAALGDAG